jgi:hypothetical protein
MERSPTAFFILLSAAAVFAGIVCILIALVTAVLDTTVFALTSTYLQVAIASFLVAIWFGVLGVLSELRRGPSPGRGW